jgi:hypothetical protein
MHLAVPEVLRVLAEVLVAQAVTALEPRPLLFLAVPGSKPLSLALIASSAAVVVVAGGPVLARPAVSVAALPVVPTTRAWVTQLLRTLVQVAVVPQLAVSTVATVDLAWLSFAMTHRTSLPKSVLQPKPLELSATPRSTHS